MQYAVNIADLIHEEVRLPASLLVIPVAPSRQIVIAERGWVDGTAIVLECDEVRAVAIATLLRKKLIRVYKSKTGKSWTKYQIIKEK